MLSNFRIQWSRCRRVTVQVGLCSILPLLLSGCGHSAADAAADAQRQQELQGLRQTNQELHQLLADNQELPTLRRDNEELERLRTQTKDLPQLRQENAELRAKIQSLTPAHR